MDGFSWGGGGGEEETPGHVQHGRFSLDDASFQTVPFFMLYIFILSSGGFAASGFGPSGTVSPVLDAPGICLGLN